MKRRALLAVLAGGALVAASPLARADSLTPQERSRLASGDVIRRHVDFDTADGPYFGGISYGVIDASPAEVMRALLDVNTYRSILPLTLEAREVGRKGDNSLVFFRQGGRLGTASYTLLVRRESPSLLRFWLDPAFPHEIEDCWGYFRVQPFGAQKTLLTYAAVLRLELGFVRMFFSEKIRSFAMDTPLRVQWHFGTKLSGR